MTPAIGQFWRVRRSGNVYRVVDERDPGTPDAVWVLALVESPSGRPEIGSKLFVDPVWFQPESELVGRGEPDRTATKGEEVPAEPQPADDRERRIRELAFLRELTCEEPVFTCSLKYADRVVSFKANVRTEGDVVHFIPLPGEVERLEREEFRRLSLAWFRLAPKMLCGMRESWLPRGEHEENCSGCQAARGAR